MKIYEFEEHSLFIKGEKEDLIQLARIIRDAGTEGTISDIAYQIEYTFDLDSVRTIDDINEEVKGGCPCDYGDCPFDAYGGYDCRNYCGLGVDE